MFYGFNMGPRGRRFGHRGFSPGIFAGIMALMFFGWIILAVIGAVLGAGAMILGSVFTGLVRIVPRLLAGIFSSRGFAVGIVDRKKAIDKEKMKAGDIVIALPSTGIHSNGFSLCRKVFDIDNNNPALYMPREELGGKTVAETLLTPTKIYVKPVLALLEKVNVKGISHITGGGFYENIPRSIPKGLSAKIDRSAVKIPPIFDLIAKVGNIPERDMFNTYNMGVGMSLVVSAADVEKALAILKENGEDAYVIGEIVESEDKITIV